MSSSPRADTASWRAAIAPLRAGGRAFPKPPTTCRSLAEAEYQRGWVEFNLLYEFEDGRRTAEAAQAHFSAAGDDDRRSARRGAARAARIQHREPRWVRTCRAPSSARCSTPRVGAHETRAGVSSKRTTCTAMRCNALTSRLHPRTRARPTIEPDAPVYAGLRARAQCARRQVLRSAARSQNLALHRRSGDGDVAQAVGDVRRACCRSSSATAIRTCTRRSSAISATALIALGEFDRALLLHTEALEVFSARGDDSQTARELAALGVDPVPQRKRRTRAGHASKARCRCTNARAIRPARCRRCAWRATRRRNSVSTTSRSNTCAAPNGRTRTASPSTARACSSPASCARSATCAARSRCWRRCCSRSNEPTRADALAERARLRQRQHRSAEALADLREADAIYARLKLDFNRIDTSSALALALLDAGDVQGAGSARRHGGRASKRSIRVNSANPGNARAFSVGELRALRSAHRSGSGRRRARRIRSATWKAFRVAEAIRARSLADRLAHVAHAGDLPRDEDDRPAARTDDRAAGGSRAPHAQGATPSDATLLETAPPHRRRHARGSKPGCSSQRGVQSNYQPRDRRIARRGAGRVAADTAVLAYFVGDERSHAWLLTRTELRHSDAARAARPAGSRQRLRASGSASAPEVAGGCHLPRLC